MAWGWYAACTPRSLAKGRRSEDGNALSVRDSHGERLSNSYKSSSRLGEIDDDDTVGREGEDDDDDDDAALPTMVCKRSSNSWAWS